MKLNTKAQKEPIFTHEGAKAAHINFEQELRRSVMSCMLWEDQFYEDGQGIAERITMLVPKVSPEKVQAITVEARTKMKLRHVPLLLVREMVRHPSHKSLVAQTLFEIIQRPDELTEFLAIYWKDGKSPIASQVKKGLAKAFTKFNEYSLAKYNRDSTIKLRDVLFLCHSKPSDAEGERYNNQDRKLNPKTILSKGEDIYKRLVDGKLETPDTWEVALSTGEDKKTAFERLMTEDKLGVMAFIRNLRNMHGAGVSKEAVKAYASRVKTERALPFRFISAARALPVWEDVIEPMMLKCLDGQEKLLGKTVLLVDVSGSMASKVSGKSEMRRLDAAAAMAILIREVCEDVVIYTTGGNDRERIHKTKVLPPRHGFALADEITKDNLGGGGIFLAQCTKYVHDIEKTADRLIVITDEQDCDQKLNPATAQAFGERNYLVNIATATNGIGYGKWIHIDGWSEAVVDYIREFEKL